MFLVIFLGYLFTTYIITANKFKPPTSDVNLGLPDFTQDSRDNLHNPNVSRWGFVFKLTHAKLLFIFNLDLIPLRIHYLRGYL